MRIHGIQIRGLESFPGEHEIALDAGHNAVVTSTPERARALWSLVRGMLYPDTALVALPDWKAGSAGRVLMSLSLRAERYQLVADFGKHRLGLACFDAESKRFQRVSTEPREIAGLLRVGGLPAREQFETLYAWGVAPTPDDTPKDESSADDTSEHEPSDDDTPMSHAAVRPQDAPTEPDLEARLPPANIDEAPEPLPAPEAPQTPAPAVATGPDVQAIEHERLRLTVELDNAERLRQERAAAPVRLGELRELRERCTQLERDATAAAEELEKRRALSDVTDDLEMRIDQFRALVEDRSLERESIEASRRALLGERTRLRVVPGRQVIPMWLGIAVAVAGLAVTGFGHPLGYVAIAIGCGLALTGLVVSRGARRRLGMVEAKLAGLRVRERNVERQFESEGALVRGLIQELELETAEELREAAAEHGTIEARASALQSELVAARNALPADYALEVARLESAADKPDPTQRIAGFRAELDALPDLDEVDLATRVPVDPDTPLDLGDTATLAGADAAPSPEDEAFGDTATLDSPSQGSPDDYGDTASMQSPPAPTDPSPAPRMPTPGDESRHDPDTLISIAAQGLARGSDDVRDMLAPILPVYLRALTGGELAQARRRQVEGWSFKGAQRESDSIDYADLSEELRSLVGLAFRLALTEGPIARLRLPFLVGPETGSLETPRAEALGRALTRIAKVTQVLHLTADARTTRHAPRSVYLA